MSTTKAKAERDYIVRVMAVLSTLRHNEVSRGISLDAKQRPAVPASSIYLAFDGDVQAYEAVAQGLVRAGLVERTGETMKLTRDGREAADRVYKKTGA